MLFGGVSLGQEGAKALDEMKRVGEKGIGIQGISDGSNVKKE